MLTLNIGNIKYNDQMLKNIILIIVAHPDDESFGMAGTIARHADNGDVVYVLYLCDGVSSRNKKNKFEKNIRFLSFKKAGEILGFNYLKSPNFPDNSMDAISLLKIVQFIEKIKKNISPEIIYTHSFSDLNIDHQLTARAVITAFRPEPKEIFKEIRLFETPSSTDFSYPSFSKPFEPNLYISIGKYINKKINAINCYKEEIRPFPHSRSANGIINLNKYRGNQVGLEYAEAFQVIKSIVR